MVNCVTKPTIYRWFFKNEMNVCGAGLRNVRRDQELLAQRRSVPLSLSLSLSAFDCACVIRWLDPEELLVPLVLSMLSNRA